MTARTQASAADLDGDPKRYPIEELYADQWPRLARLGFLLTGSQARGEELAQDAFVGLLRRGEAENAIREPAAYLRRSVVNLAVNEQRRRRRERRYIDGLTEPVALLAEHDELWVRLLALPPRQRAVLVLRFYEDLSVLETAEVLTIRPGTVKSLTAQAVSRLRKELGNE